MKYLIIKNNKSIGSAFTRVLASYFMSNVADRAAFIFLSWFIIKNYGSSSLNYFICFSLIPHLIFIILSQKANNQFGPVKVFIFSDTVKLLLYLTMSVLILFRFNLDVFLLSAIGFLTNMGSAFFNPAAMAMPAFLSKDKLARQSMTAYLSLSLSLSVILGPLLSSLFLLTSYDKYLFVFLILASIYMLPIVNNFIVNKCCYQSALESSALKISTISASKKYPDVFYLLACFFLINIVFVPIQYFIPLYVKNNFSLHGGYIFALFEASIGFGSFVGAAFVSRIKGYLDSIKVLFTAFLFTGIAYFCFGLSVNIVFSSLSLFLMGVFLAVGNVFAITYYQNRVQHIYVSLIMSLVNLISVSVAPLAIFLSGQTVRFLGLTISVKLYALFTVLISIAILFARLLIKREVKCESVTI